MIKNYPVLKKFASLIFLLFSLTAFSQQYRYIRLQKSGTNTTNYINLAEIQVIDMFGTNRSLAGTATSSSTNPGGAAINGKDNNTDGNWSNNSVFHSLGTNTNEWWEIDLGALYSLSKINIYNRTDCCWDRLSNMYVMASDTPFNTSGSNAANLTAALANSDFTYQFGGVSTSVMKVVTPLSSASYCPSSGNTAYQTGITFVNFNTISNISAKPGGYTDYTLSQTTNVIAGTSYNLSVKLNTAGNYTIFAIAWIDWNQDGVFDDPGEAYPLGSTSNNPDGVSSFSPVSIPIPAAAVFGSTKMRISSKWKVNAGSCDTGFDGEVEDYTINIIPPITTGTISPISYCPGASVSIPYTIAATFNAGNIFTAQLSNASGSFASPFNIGSLTSTTADTISGTIPIGTVAGTGYRIRVVSSNSTFTGRINTSNLTVNAGITNNTFDFTTGNYGTTSATAAENANAVLTAPAGKYFMYVGFASYGTPTGTAPNFAIGGCNAATSQSVTEGYLIGNVGTATIPATNGVFGDPCVGTIKRLTVQASYTTPICSGTSPGLITGTTPTGGNGTFTYLWESSTTSATAGFGNAVGTRTNKDYSPPALTQTTWLRRTVFSGGCSNVSAVILLQVNAAISAPTVGAITQPTCATPTGSVVLSGLPAGNWTINPGTIAGTGASKTITGLAVGTHNFTVTNASGCNSVASAKVVINAQSATTTAPIVGTITQLNCATATGSVVLNGLPSGLWQLTRSPGNVITTGTGTSTTISGLAPGTYTYSVIGANNGTGLKGEYFNSAITGASPPFPLTPPILTRIDPIVNFNFWGNGSPDPLINNDNFLVRWSGQIQPLYSDDYIFSTNSDDGIRLWVNGTRIINNWGDHGPTINTSSLFPLTLVAGVKYDIVLEYYENGGGAVAQLYWSSATSQANQIIPQSQLYPSAFCSSPASANVIINAQPATPSAPTVGTITQPTCATATGSVALNGLPATGTWTINPGGITGTGTSKTISGLAAGTYTYTVMNAGGCTSVASANVVVNAQPATPTAPTVGTITQPTCATPTGSVVLSGLPLGSWTINPGAIAGNTANSTISGLAAGTYTYTVTNAGGCTSVASENVVINAQPSINTWNGSLNTNWDIAGNWCIGVPTFGVPNTLDVLIPAGLTNYPIILAGSVLGGYVKNIVFEPGTTLNVVDNRLRVTNNLTLNGKIDLIGESQLLQDMGSTFDPLSTGSIEIDQQGEGNKYRYNYWSMPVNTLNDGNNYTTIFASLRDGTVPSSPAPITFKNTGYDGALTTPITLSTYWMFKYANSGSGYSAWNQIRSTGKVYTGQGFTLKGPGAPGSPAQNYVFVGKPNNGTINLTVAANYGYLVGNPYPSALDADQFILDNALSITGPIYFWEHYGGDTHNLAGYQGGYATYSLGGGVQASAFPGLAGGISVKGKPARYIPIGQAFFVVGDAIDGGQIQFNNGQRIFVKESELDINGDSFSVFMKSSNTKSKTANSAHEDLRPKFRIGYDAPKISHRQLLLTIDERATPNVDWGFDAEIYEIFADDMYWMLEGEKYVIQATNAIGLNSEVPLGIQLSKTGTVKVKIDALENVDDDTLIYLKDKLTGESFNMKEKAVQLNLTAGKYTDRFVIVFKTQKLVAEDVNAEVLIPVVAQPIIEGIHVFMNNTMKELQIKNNSTEEITSVALRNSLGQTVRTWNSNFKIRTISLPVNTATGVYVVQIITKNGLVVQKVIVE